MRQIVFLMDKPGVKEIEVPLNKEGEEVEVLGVVLADGEGDYKVRLVVDHEKGNTYGRVFIRGIARDKAKVDLKGKIKIRKGANGVDDFLELRVLMGDEQSMAMAEPELEIEANEVKASHAATVGKIEDEEKNYLMSRGIEEKKAEAMIEKGFLQVVAERTISQEEKERLQLAIEKYANR